MTMLRLKPYLEKVSMNGGWGQKSVHMVYRWPQRRTKIQTTYTQTQPWNIEHVVRKVKC